MQIKPVSNIPTSNNSRKQAEIHVFEWRNATAAGLFDGFEKVLTPVAAAALSRGKSQGSQAEHAAQLLADRSDLAESYLERQYQMQRYAEQDEDTRSYTVSLSA